MNKFLPIIKNTWSEFFQYRLNFIMWRVRNLFRFLVIYFLWWAIFSSKNTVFGYDQTKMLTYILLSSLVTSIVFSTRTADIGAEINQGDLSNLLLRPLNVFYYWAARDIGDKLLNIFFSIIEVSLLIFLLQPPLFFQTNTILLLAVFLSITTSVVLYFLISILLSFFGFWSPDVWSPRFLFMIIVEFFAGGLFPLDILPKPLFAILQFLPFNYLLFFPIKIYLGQLNIIAIIKGFAISLVWVGILYEITKKVWHKGLIVYGAYGR